MIVVIPSNRAVDLVYLRPLIDSGARFIVVDDSPGSIQVNHPSFEVFNWEARRRILGDLDSSFARCNGACRDVGFYIAWREADPQEIIIALDDDCEIEEPRFAACVEQALSPAVRPVFTGKGRHSNILDLYEESPAHLFPRGFPYEERRDYVRWKVGNSFDHRAPEFNLGLWRDVFDVNAIDKINGPEWRHPQATLTAESVVVPRGALVSVCSMNMQFRRTIIPAVFQFPMHVEVMPNWVIDRYGDIWGGFLMKMLMDIRGDALAVGAPMISHRKSGDMKRNSWQEHICHMVNAELIDLLCDAAGEVRAGDYLQMMGDAGEGISRRCCQTSPLLRPYMRHLTASMAAWLTALSRPAA